MRVLLANPRGFCAGVRMAINALDLALQRCGPPVYVFHEIVHNRHVVANFRSRGVVFVESIDDVPQGAVVMYSAHGVSPAVRQRAHQRDLRAVDATCPLVAKVHLEAIRLSRLDYTILLVGHKGHDEIVGTTGEAPDSIRLVETVEDVDCLDYSSDTKLAWLTQTTLSVDDATRVTDRLAERYPNIVGPPRDDICYATQNRQQALKSLCGIADAVVVVGSANSSNSQRLRELAEQHNVKAWLVDDAARLEPADFLSFGTVAVTAGASAPESAVESVVDWFVDHFAASVEVHTIVDEDRAFPLPRELREPDTLCR